MNDLTLVFYTANVLREPFGAYVRAQLLRAAGDQPLVSVSQQPMTFGTNICVGAIGRSHLNIYRQILIGAKAAMTPWIALVEDDILYPPGHFDYRPSRPDVAAYNMHKWAWYSWSAPSMFKTSSARRTNGCIVARDLLIAALEERFARWPGETAPLHFWGEIGRYERGLRVTVRQSEEFRSEIPLIICFHADALGFQISGERKKQPRPWRDELPYWGTAQALQDVWSANRDQHSSHH